MWNTGMVWNPKSNFMGDPMEEQRVQMLVVNHHHRHQIQLRM
jgi:hypothetical protein